MAQPLPDFLEENQDVIKCLSLNTADALFSAYMMLSSDGFSDGLLWNGAWNAIEAAAALRSCEPPPYEAFEEAFEGQNKHCQCAEVGGQLFLDWLDAAGNRTTLSNSELVEAKQIKDAAIAEGIASCNWITVEGEAKTATYDIQDGSKPEWYIVPTLNTDCCVGTPSPPAVQPPPAPYIFGEPDADCGSRVRLLDSCIDRYGFAQNFYKVENNYYTCTGESVPDYYYWETIDGPSILYVGGTPLPYQLFCNPPHAYPHPHAAIPTSSGGGTSSLSAVTYTLDAGCTYNQETEDFDTKFTYDVEATDDGIVGLARRMDALAWMINNSGLIPYTTCATTKPKLEGEWVSTHWISDGASDNSKQPLRKLFRYRTKSDRTTKELRQHWKQLIWESGSVVVGHKGAWWGTPQVWALNEEEGKRVLRFAGGEAGLDPDLDGEWFVGSSRSPRIGMKGRMRLARREGDYWVSSRDGSDGEEDLSHDP